MKRRLLLAAALAVPAAALANPLTGSIIHDHGWGLWAAVSALIVIVEWPIFVMLTGCPWLWGLLGVAVANAASAGVGYAIGPASSVIPAALALGLCIEGGALYGLTRLLRLPSKEEGRVVAAVIVMNVATVWIAPSVSFHVPTSFGAASLCMSNQKRIGTALLTYASDYERLPPAKSVAGLEAVLMEPTHYYLLPPDDYLFTCPAVIRWGVLPPAKGTISYRLLLPLLPGPADSWPDPAQHILITDDAPRHENGRVCTFYDGHVKWMREAQVMKALMNGNKYD